MYSTYRLTLSAILLGVMLILGFIEHALPSVGLPGIKLGLSNGVLIFAVYMLDLPTAWILMAMKVILSGFMFSGVNAMFYAFAGGVLSLAGMSLLSRIPKMPAVAVSVAGGILHNIGQLGMAMLIAQLPMQFLAYVLILVSTGAVSGALTGTAAALVMKHLKAGGFQMGKPSREGNLAAVVAAVIIVAAAGLLGWRHLDRGMRSAGPVRPTPRNTAGPVESAEDAGPAVTSPAVTPWTPEDFRRFAEGAGPAESAAPVATPTAGPTVTPWTLEDFRRLKQP